MGTYGGQRTACPELFSHSAMWIPGIKIRLMDLVANPFMPPAPSCWPCTLVF